MRQRRVTITGTGGQLGSALQRRFGADWVIDRIARPETDICDWPAVRTRIAHFLPDLVIHAAAATDVDLCETQPDTAFRINALGTRNVAHAAASVGAELVYVSTNYVFDGEKPGPYHEFDVVRPISVYGASKLAGEQEARGALARCHVVRTAWLYAPSGRNFALTMARLMAERDHLTVVADQFGNPTSADDLAGAIAEVVTNAPYGVHHAVNAGSASWYEWAVAIAQLLERQVVIEPIPASAWARPARPPANGVLTSLSLPTAGIELPDWRDALVRTLRS